MALCARLGRHNGGAARARPPPPPLTARSSSSGSGSGSRPRRRRLRSAPIAAAVVPPEAAPSSFSAPVSTFDDDLPHELDYLDWRWGSKIHFVRAGRSGPPVLLVHGFGVGAFHYEKNIPELAKTHRVFAVDLLGQANSWYSTPDCPESGPLRCSADTWTEQLLHFIQERIGEPCYVAGNSLGGYLGVHLAARHPEVVKGLVLLNATPFWSSRPPLGKEGLLWRLLGIDGRVPAPQFIKSVIERSWWSRIRQPDTVRSLLRLVYARPEAIDDALAARIIAAAQHPSALDSFTSILLSPRTELSFDDMLGALRCPVCLAYGRDDPWVVPIWAMRLKRTLPAAKYLQLAPAGHCPHHEAPTAVNEIIKTWVAAVEAGEHEGHELLQAGASRRFEEEGGQEVTVTCLEGLPSNVFERWDDASWRLKQALRQALEGASRLAQGGGERGAGG